MFRNIRYANADPDDDRLASLANIAAALSNARFTSESDLWR
jgi:hypothetical protein